MSKICYFDHCLTKHHFRFLDFSNKNYIFMKNYFIHGIRIKWISDSNPSHRKDSDGQIISPYACHIAICHPKMCFHKAGQASLNQQSDNYISIYLSVGLLLAAVIIRRFGSSNAWVLQVAMSVPHKSLR